MRTISQVLDRAKKAQKVPSDYKLALTLGIGLSALSNYRNGRSFPDENACVKLAAAIGEEPELLMVEMQAQRTKDVHARAMWERLARRLQSGMSSIKMMLLVAIVSIAAHAAPALAAAYIASSIATVTKIYIVEYLSRVYVALRKFVKNCKVRSNVPRKTHTLAPAAA